jgi:molecular chaperone GrpE
MSSKSEKPTAEAIEEQQESIEAAKAVSEEDAAVAEESIEAMKDALDTMTQKAEENWDKYVRAQAELDNVIRRSKRDLANAHKFALEKFVNELLPVRDSLEMGLDHAEGESIDIERLKEGSELTLRMLSQVMEKFGILQVDPVDEPFNPELHEAMTMQPSGDVDPNTVLAVIQKGYTLNERLIRPARVVVSKAADNDA